MIKSVTTFLPPLLVAAVIVFLMRLADVSLGTLRIGMVVKGKRRWAGLLGFFESLIWVLAARQVLGDLDEPVTMVAYAAGYGAGTMFGATIERWLAMGNVLVRIVSSVTSPPAYPALRDAGFPVTVLNGEGRDGQVQISFTVIPRRRLAATLDLIRFESPGAFVTVEDAKTADVAIRPSPVALRK